MKYRAPTWSWGSVEGEITWGIVLSHYKPTESVIHILDTSVISEGRGEPGQALDPTGQVKMGHIRLRGRLWSTKGFKWRASGAICSRYGQGEALRTVRREIDNVRQWGHEELFLLIIYNLQLEHGTKQIYGLVLSPDQCCPATFRRVGIFSSYGLFDEDIPVNEFTMQEEQVITLV